MNTETPTTPLNAQAGARILLLFLATVLFGSAWESDARHQEKVIAQRRGNPSSRTIVRQTEPGQRSSQHLDQTLAPPSGGQVEVRGVGQTREWPLPVGLAAGYYRVVDSFGAVEVVQVTRADLHQRGVVEGRPARDMYLVDESERRIYYIRLQSPQRISQR